MFFQKEKEYLECRKSLAKVKQRKLLLTSHLDHIILHNEQEKAAKLAELELSLGLAPSTPPPAHTVTPISTGSTSASSPRAAALTPSNGPSPAVVAAAAESAARLAAVQAAATVPPDHPGLRLDAVAPPAFAGFEEESQHQPTSQFNHAKHTNPTPTHNPTNPFGPPTPVASATPPPTRPPTATTSSAPSPATVATSRHVTIPPKQSTIPAPRAAQTALSIANKNKPSPLSYTADGTFAGFAD